jgi:hypothetical protein
VFIVDEINCKEFNSVTDVILGGCDGTGTGGFVSFGIK